MLTIVLLAVTNSFLFCVPSRAQIPSVLQGCSSPAVTNEKLQTNADEIVQNSDRQGGAHRKVIVDRLEFDRPVHLSESDVEQVIQTTNEIGYNADTSGWVDELTEIGLRSAWQNQGYFEIDVAADAQSIGGDSDHERYLVAVHVEKEGPQFHLGEVRFTGATAIPEAELQQVFPMREGEFFSVEKMRAGIQTLTKLYASHGYIDFTAVPETKADDNLQRISLLMRLDEQTQFRVGDLVIQGFTPSLEARLRSIIVPGEVFNPEPVQTFFKQYRSVLPSHDLENFEARRNIRAGTVDLTFGPRSCPYFGIEKALLPE
ncbi:MAG TPA: POTRA domain-containing protein [Candidatus Acidoferrales bacterium]|nr:POTRA domain-containing protein [Candidatus Acidoferrales bacterium]